MFFESEMNNNDMPTDIKTTMPQELQLDYSIIEIRVTNFSMIKFRKNAKYRFSGSSSRSQKTVSSLRSGSGKGFNTWMVDRSKFRCYNYDKMGLFSNECRRPKQAEQRKETVQKDRGGQKKYPLKSYIDEGKNWDDIDYEEEKYGFLHNKNVNGALAS